jgi:hypothetical protein
MHQASRKSLGLIGDELRQKSVENEATHQEQTGKRRQKSQSPHTRRSSSPGGKNYKAQREDARNIITQARVNRSRYEWDEGNYEDKEKEMGALCFTRRVRRTHVPKGFKLPHDQQKYAGRQEPKLWLSDYLQVVKILGGSRATAMQSLQLHLTGAAQSWLSKLPDDSIKSWGKLEDQFTRNFHSTYTRSASIEEVKSCVQKSGKMLHSYIQRWSIIKNSAENISDERAIDAFAFGLRCSDLVE